jgi:hypothetical protein
VVVIIPLVMALKLPQPEKLGVNPK